MQRMATLKTMRGTREKSGMLLKEEGGEIDDNLIWPRS